jgi:16S rRNA (uracil1498-N3)-methyltransferase
VRRFFIDGDAVRDGGIHIEDEGDVRHIKSVLRMKPGDSLAVCDGAGREYRGTIEEIGAAVRLSVDDIVHASEPRAKVALYQCVPKQGKMETIIQKSTELGAARFVPVFSERSVPKPKDVERKAARWQRVAEEASKQSGRAKIPVVDIPLSLPEAAETFGEYDLVIFPYENEDRATIKDVLRAFAARFGREGRADESSADFGDFGDLGDPADSADEKSRAAGAPEQTGVRRAGAGPRIAVVIGPEGGFTDAEAFAIADAGASPCSLGGTILRTETAGPAAIAMMMYELEL